jgi:hypothetical protein
MLRPLTACLLAAGLAVGCDGGDVASPELAPPSTPSLCVGDTESVASPRRVRRLGDHELEAVASDLLGAPALGIDDLIADPRVDGWETDARAFVVSVPKLDSYVTLSAKLAPGLAKTAACAPSDTPRGCAARYARRLATRAFGRAVSNEEVDDLLAVYDTGTKTEGADAGLRMIAQAILLAPSTLYRTEIGVAEPGATEARLTDWEIASQLSFLLHGSRPDDELREAAAKGALHDPQSVVAHARRLLETPRARVQVQRLVEGWLELGKLDAVRRSREYPELTPKVRAAMKTELHRFVDHVVFEGSGTFDELLGSSVSFPGPELAPIYGADLLDVPRGSGPVALDPKHRKGVLSLPAFLTGHATFDATNPVDRGLFVRTRLFCQEFSAPPVQAFALPVVAGADDGTTTRQKFESHSTDPLCKGCHDRIDPIGFGLEGFDAIGRFRTTEHGLPIDDSGFLTDADVTGPFRGPAELADLVSRSEDARTCFVAQVVRFAEGSNPEALCEVTSLKQAFLASGRRITDLLLAYIARREFYVRRIVGDGVKVTP